MAEAREGEAEQPPSPRIHSYARDLLRRFSGGFPEDFRVAESSATEEDSAKIELSLGLSLGGCFGVDPSQRRGLVRSSSVASLPFLQRGEQDPPAIPVLARTCSLPVEAEEEQRKRKELQSLRRLEAKRKRSEKRNNSRVAGRDRAAALAEESRGESMQLDGDGGAEKEEEKAEGERFRAWCPPAPNGTAVARAAARAVEGTRGFAPGPQGSMGSPGSSSSGVSDFDNRPLIRQGSGVSGLGSGTESRSPSIFQPLPNHTESKAAMSPMSPVVGRQPSYTQMEVEDSLKQAAAAAGGGNGLRNMMEEMPCVSTRGSGPGGRKVEGFLYRYRKGEEVRIVCVCHGSFFSPAEFVKHAGGGDVAHPLRHIVVNPNPSSIL